MSRNPLPITQAAPHSLLRRRGAFAEPILPLRLRLQSFRSLRSKEIEAADKERVLTHATRAEHRGAGRRCVETDDRLVRMRLRSDGFHNAGEWRGSGLR